MLRKDDSGEFPPLLNRENNKMFPLKSDREIKKESDFDKNLKGLLSVPPMQKEKK